jgi:TetR/AcrR family transcriptional repressor of nem operon
MSSAEVQPQYSPKAQEIIQRTNELLASGGYNGFSYADIAELVDVRKASIHHHFPAKVDLVRATVAQHICALLAAELPSIPAEVAEEVTGHFNDLQTWLTQIMTDGEAKGVMRLAEAPSDEAAVFMASIHGAMLSARATGNALLFWQIAKLSTDRLKIE